MLKFFRSVLGLFTGVLKQNNKLQKDSSQKLDEKKVVSLINPVRPSSFTRIYPICWVFKFIVVELGHLYLNYLHFLFDQILITFRFRLIFVVHYCKEYM